MTNPSACSEQKSDCERFAPIDLYKRATVSYSLRSLKTKEVDGSNLRIFTSKVLFRSQKTSESLENESRIPNPDFTRFYLRSMIE